MLAPNNAGRRSKKLFTLRKNAGPGKESYHAAKPCTRIAVVSANLAIFRIV
jgi:hypothetical protein